MFTLISPLQLQNNSDPGLSSFVTALGTPTAAGAGAAVSAPALQPHSPTSVLTAAASTAAPALSVVADPFAASYCSVGHSCAHRNNTYNPRNCSVSSGTPAASECCNAYKTCLINQNPAVAVVADCEHFAGSALPPQSAFRCTACLKSALVALSLAASDRCEPRKNSDSSPSTGNRARTPDFCRPQRLVSRCAHCRWARPPKHHCQTLVRCVSPLTRLRCDRRCKCTAR